MYTRETSCKEKESSALRFINDIKRGGGGTREAYHHVSETLFMESSGRGDIYLGIFLQGRAP